MTPGQVPIQHYGDYGGARGPARSALPLLPLRRAGRRLAPSAGHDQAGGQHRGRLPPRPRGRGSTHRRRCRGRRAASRAPHQGGAASRLRLLGPRSRCRLGAAGALVVVQLLRLPGGRGPSGGQPHGGGGQASAGSRCSSGHPRPRRRRSAVGHRGPGGPPGPRPLGRT